MIGVATRRKVIQPELTIRCNGSRVKDAEPTGLAAVVSDGVVRASGIFPENRSPNRHFSRFGEVIRRETLNLYMQYRWRSQADGRDQKNTHCDETDFMSSFRLTQ